ncbi:uncharacterized protein LOC136089518 isoform X1 [Hydra vulgaris]|uniref:Uncharacterized protein LOC136089518 isoform X1 n=1 Tax=Hydra vulgaris TaxID=6087 RepID=A0ABM4DBB1_HYDVU
MEDLVSEMIMLENTGFRKNDKCYSIKLKAVICDAPARSFKKCIKLHNGYNFCERCVQTGVWLRKVAMPNLFAVLRTDSNFRNKKDPDHHSTLLSPLENLNIGLVSGFPLDYMHLVCLGVVRRLINQWIRGLFIHRLSRAAIDLISDKLVAIKSYTPREFARKPRSLSEYKHWKATELRQFLLYSGVVVLKGILPKELYVNFLCLSVAIRILTSPSLYNIYVDYSEKLLKYFVSNFCMLYGNDQCVNNVHSLIHLPDDVRRFGVLDNVSLFPFESYLGRLKKLIRSLQSPVTQIICRLSEGHLQYSKTNVADFTSKFKKQHFYGPVPLPLRHLSQFKQYFGSKFLVSNQNGNNCFAIDNKICLVKNILAVNNSNESEAFVVYLEFDRKEPFFTDLLDSSLPIYFLC